MTFHLFRPRAPSDDQHLAALKEWTSGLLPAPAEATLMIQNCAAQSRGAHRWKP